MKDRNTKTIFDMKSITQNAQFYLSTVSINYVLFHITFPTAHITDIAIIFKRTNSVTH